MATTNPDISVVVPLYNEQESLPELLAWAAGGGAQALGMEDALGEIAPGRRCGLTVISGLDYGTLCLTPASQIHRIL